jgi:hypothetical protein
MECGCPFVIPTGLCHGVFQLPQTIGALRFSNHSPWKRWPSLCHPDRIVPGPFSYLRRLEPFGLATTLHGSVGLPFVIPTGLCRGSFSYLRRLEPFGSATTLHGSVGLPFVIPTGLCHGSFSYLRRLEPFGLATTLHGSVGLPFVIPTGLCRGSFSYLRRLEPFGSATTLHGSVGLPFVIPSGAEGSAVQRIFPGSVFRQEPSHAPRFLFTHSAYCSRM